MIQKSWQKVKQGAAKPRFWIAGLVVFVVLAVVYAVSRTGTSSTKQDALYIAVIAPMSGANRTDGEDTVRGVNLCLDQFNAEGGVNGRPVKMLVYDDANKADQAKEKALEVITQTQALVVLGHAQSSAALKAGEVYKQYGIPAITGSATADNVTTENEWYFRVVPSSRSQAVFLAHYVKKILKYDKASIVYDQDDYGTTLAKPFESLFQELGGEIKGVWSFNTKEETINDQLNTIVDNLAEQDPGMVFLAVHAVEGNKIVTGLRYRGLSYPIIGASAFANLDFIEGFDRYAEELATPGYFSDGIFTTAPLMFDVAGNMAQEFRTEYVHQYGVAPGMKAATNCDAARLAVEAMRTLKIQGRAETLAQDRQQIRDYLAGLDSIEKAIPGVTGPLYFDQNRNVAKPTAIGVYQKQNLVSAMTQLNPVTDLKRIPDLQKALDEEQIILMDGQYMYRTRVVYAGLDINEISSLDTGKSTYTLDFYLWFRYRGEFSDSDIEFINAASKFTLDKPIAETTTDGVTYRAYRVKNAFVGDFDFHNYPFDRQVLSVRFRHRALTNENLVYVVDMLGMPRLAKGTWTEYLRTHALKSAEGWSIDQASIFQDTLTQNSTLGNPNMLLSNPTIVYSKINAEVYVKRDALSYSIKNLFPVFILIVVGYLVLFMPAKVLPPRVGVTATAILTTASFSARLSSDLPSRVGYLSALEYVFFVIYILCLYGMLVSSLDYKYEGKAWMKQMNVIGRIAYPIVVLLTFAIIVWVYVL